MKLDSFIAGLLTIAIVPFVSTQAKSQSAANNPALSSGSGPQVNFGELMNAQVGSMRFAGKVVVEGAKPFWDPIPNERIAALQALQKKWRDVANATDHALQLNRRLSEAGPGCPEDRRLP